MNIKVNLAEWLKKFDKKVYKTHEKQLRETYTIDYINFSLLKTKMNTTTYSYL